jgi:hypothetical protein
MLSKRLPRVKQCCGNCTAFIPDGNRRQVAPNVQAMSGFCARLPPTPFPAQVRSGSVLDINGPQIQQGTQSIYPPVHEGLWCRDAWEFNPELKEASHGVEQPQQVGQAN